MQNYSPEIQAQMPTKIGKNKTGGHKVESHKTAQATVQDIVASQVAE